LSREKRMTAGRRRRQTPSQRAKTVFLLKKNFLSCTLVISYRRNSNLSGKKQKETGNPINPSFCFILAENKNAYSVKKRVLEDFSPI
ncbi:MAG: hypothetical protein LIP00_05310, partial [Parabacteroides sp.]|nr:hypothetical protein [Parabacteroides sp.]